MFWSHILSLAPSLMTPESVINYFGASWMTWGVIYHAQHKRKKKIIGYWVYGQKSNCVNSGMAKSSWIGVNLESAEDDYNAEG